MSPVTKMVILVHMQAVKWWKSLPVKAAYTVDTTLVSQEACFLTKTYLHHGKNLYLGQESQLPAILKVKL